VGAQTRVTRPATIEDVPAIRAILAAHGNDGPVTRFDIVGPYVRHLVTRHRALLTEEDGTPVAYGAVVDAGVAIQLADLFVVPDRLGTGLGRPLLAALFGEAPRRTTFASDDPRALPAYVRAGMTPLWPCLYVEGDGGGLVAPAGLEVVAALPEELAALELAWTGVDRLVDHRFWASQADGDPFLVADRDGPVALAVGRARQVSDVRVVDRMLVRPGADPVAPVLAALRRTDRGGRVMTHLFGPSPVLPVLLEHGFHVVDRDQYMASDAGLIDPVRLLPNPAML
jgi:GNAT superfamily N-acetyltransferase